VVPAIAAGVQRSSAAPEERRRIEARASVRGSLVNLEEDADTPADLERREAELDALVQATRPDADTQRRLGDLTRDFRKQIAELEAQIRAQADAGASDPASRQKLKALTEQYVQAVKVLVDPNTGGFATFVTDPFLSAGLPGMDKRIDVDLDNATLREAAKQVAERGGLDAEVTVDEDVPADARITLRTRNVRVSTALELIAQAANTGWGYERKDNKAQLHFGKNVRRGFTLGQGFFKPDKLPTLQAPGFVFSQGGVRTPDVGRFFVQRKTFVCPHCKGRTTMVVENTQPKCPKCERTFQPDWKFCPVDGTKRPPSPGEWHHCPLCGKEVDVEKSDAAPEQPSAATGTKRTLPIGMTRRGR